MNMKSMNTLRFTSVQQSYKIKVVKAGKEKRGKIITTNPISIRVYPRKRGWPDLSHFVSNLSNSHSPSRLIHGALFLQNVIIKF